MPHLYTSEQEDIRRECERTLAAQAQPDAVRRALDGSGEYDRDLWRTACELGWPALGVAEAAGGLGLGPIETSILSEACGRVVATLPMLSAQAPVIHLLEAAGGHQALLGQIAAGERIVVFAFGEGAEFLPQPPQARIADGHLHGRKSGVIAGAVADEALVWAAGEDGAPAVARVDLNGPGVAREVLHTIDNGRCHADLVFGDAPAQVLDLADASAAVRAALDRLALALAAEATGGAAAAIDMAVAYANQRAAFGQVIGKFQGVKHAIAEAWVFKELAKASVLDASVRLAAGEAGAGAYAASARLNAIEAFEEAAAMVTQIHGGIGVTWEADVHLYFRRARVLAVESGAAPYWEDRLVETMDLR